MCIVYLFSLSVLSDREASFHVDVFKSAPAMYARSADKEHLLDRLLSGFDNVFGDLNSCLAGCQKPVDKRAEFEEDDGDLASNFGEQDMIKCLWLSE